MLLTAFNRTVVDIVDAIRNRPRAQYELEEDLPAPTKRRVREQPEPEPVVEPVKPKKTRCGTG